MSLNLSNKLPKTHFKSTVTRLFLHYRIPKCKLFSPALSAQNTAQTLTGILKNLKIKSSGL